MVKKTFEREKVTFLNHVFDLLFVCLLCFTLFIFYKFTEPAQGRMSYRSCSSFEPNAVTFSDVLFSFPSSLQ